MLKLRFEPIHYARIPKLVSTGVENGVCCSQMSVIFAGDSAAVRGRFPFSQNFLNSGSAVNGTRFVGSSHWKIPRKSGKSKKVGPFSRTEFRVPFTRFSYFVPVPGGHGRAPRRTGVYDQMEQLFTNRRFHFCSRRNFRVSF